MWLHDKLAEDLAIAIGPTPFLQVPLGSIRLSDGTQLADVVTIKPSYVRFNVSIYEIKVSRADFQSDIRTGKWKGYLNHCHRFYFATPSDIVNRLDIPEEAGWIARSDKGWHVRKGATKRDINIPEQTLLSMLFVKQRATLRQRKLDAISTINYERGRNNLSYTTPYAKQLSSHFGKEVAEAISLKDEYEKRLTVLRLLDEKLYAEFKDDYPGR